MYQNRRKWTFDSGHIVIMVVWCISFQTIPWKKMKIDGNVRKWNQKKKNVQPDYCFHFKLFNRVSLWCTLFWPLNTFQPTFFSRSSFVGSRNCSFTFYSSFTVTATQNLIRNEHKALISFWMHLNAVSSECVCVCGFSERIQERKCAML